MNSDIHELQTELLNMKEKSEMKSHVSANMCSIDQTVPSRTVESEPENVLNTLSPGRSQRWILPHELETPHRQTSSGLQSSMGSSPVGSKSTDKGIHPATSMSYSTCTMG